jgi:DNA-binding transcriptional MerR regulator
MNTYQISDLERLTGVKAHTIRIWEKRYNIIQPHRTPTNIRYYDDKQVLKLLNVTTLLSQGYKISAVSSLNQEEINKEILLTQTQSSDDATCIPFINELTIHTLTFDEPAFEKIFSAIVTRLGMYKAIILVFYPFLNKIGVLWSISELMPAQEHFASTILRRKIISAIDGLAAATKTTKKFLLFLPPNEWHEISLLLSDYLIRSKGYQTIYLGQNVPYQNVDLVIQKTMPSTILSFYISPAKESELTAAYKKLLAKYKKMEVLVSGNYSIMNAHLFSKKITVLKKPEDLLRFL